MKKHMLLRDHLLDKFNELPVPANAATNWKAMEKTLQIAMPVGLLGLAVYFKVWLSKKLILLWIAGLTLSTGVTALIVYQSRNASVHQATVAAKPHLNSVSPAIVDTAKTTADQFTKVASRKQKTMAIRKDTVVGIRNRKTMPDSGTSNGLTLKQRWLRGDTTIHFTRKSKTVAGRIDTLGIARKNKTTVIKAPGKVGPLNLKQRWLGGDTSVHFPPKNKTAPLPKDTSAKHIEPYKRRGGKE